MATCNDTTLTVTQYNTAYCAGSISRVDYTALGCSPGGNVSIVCVANFSAETYIPPGSVLNFWFNIGDLNCASKAQYLQTSAPYACVRGAKTWCNESEWYQQDYSDANCTIPHGPQWHANTGCNGLQQTICFVLACTGLCVRASSRLVSNDPCSVLCKNGCYFPWLIKIEEDPRE